MPPIYRVVAAGALALLVFAATSAAVVPHAGRYAGSTSQASPDGSLGTVQIKMTHRGKRIKGLDISWLASCDNGFTDLSQGTHAAGTVTSRGRFHGGDTYYSDQGNLQGTQYTAMVTDQLDGRFVSRRRATGSFQASAVLRDASGAQVATCTTPPIAWSATRR